MKKIRSFLSLAGLLVIPFFCKCQPMPDIEFAAYKDTIYPLDPLYALFKWGNSSKRKIKVIRPDLYNSIQVRRLQPDPSNWLHRDGLSDVGGVSMSGESLEMETPPGYSFEVYYKICPLGPNEYLEINNKVLTGFQPGEYQVRCIYFPSLQPKIKKGDDPFIGDGSCCKIIEFNFTVLDAPPANETALYDYLIKNDLANYVHNYRYAPERIPLFEEALLLAPETSSLKPFIHQTVADILTQQLYNAPKPYSDEELAVLYERIVYHLRKVAESKHPYLLQNLSTDLSSYQFELQAVKARMRRK
ncbi:MAG: hypothetical protein KF852_00655 [Saprospiraceae bacterium]|nr:hypothetical protein [Saprospiraceae bacterium]